MTRTITALFDSRDDAETGKQRLSEANVSADHIHIHDQSSEGFSTDRYSDHPAEGFWAKIKHAFLPDDDRHTYEEGVRRGGYLLTADVDEAEADAAIAALRTAPGVDMEQRASEWRAQGWSRPETSAGAAGASIAERVQAAHDRDTYGTAGRARKADQERSQMERREDQAPAHDPDWSAAERQGDLSGSRLAAQPSFGRREEDCSDPRVRSYIPDPSLMGEAWVIEEVIAVRDRERTEDLSGRAPSETDALQDSGRLGRT